VWSSADVRPGRSRPRTRRGALVSARSTVIEAYRFLVQEWEAGDRLLLFGAGRGGSCALALARLLGAVGVLNADLPGWTAEDFRAYALSTFVLPRTVRDKADWERIGRLAARLSGRTDVATGVAFLGLWDCAAVPGLPRTRVHEPLPNVESCWHAVAIDGGGTPLLVASGDAVQQVWFRGARRDVIGGPDACRPLAGIALDWVLDGAVLAGAVVCPYPERTAPTAVDALAGSAHPVAVRSVPADASVHASVDSYARAHPSYWRRLPAEVLWTDLDWAARCEQLVTARSGPGAPPPPNTERAPTLAAVS
jgi:hypothetical protein